MAGMTTTGTASTSDYGDRSVIIEVSGLRRQAVMKTSNYQVKVPYNQMSQAMQSINRMGGKVAKVTVASSSSTERSSSEAASPSDEAASAPAKPSSSEE